MVGASACAQQLGLVHAGASVVTTLGTGSMTLESDADLVVGPTASDVLGPGAGSAAPTTVATIGAGPPVGPAAAASDVGLVLLLMMLLGLLV